MGGGPGPVAGMNTEPCCVGDPYLKGPPTSDGGGDCLEEGAATGGGREKADRGGYLAGRGGEEQRMEGGKPRPLGRRRRRPGRLPGLANTLAWYGGEWGC